MILSAYFAALLQKIDTTDRPLAIILDSVDQLSMSDSAHALRWLPPMIPPGVYCIISMVSSTLSKKKNQYDVNRRNLHTCMLVIFKDVQVRIKHITFHKFYWIVYEIFTQVCPVNPHSLICPKVNIAWLMILNTMDISVWKQYQAFGLIWQLSWHNVFF